MKLLTYVRGEVLTNKRIDVADKIGLTKTVDYLVNNTKHDISAILCYLSRNPENLGKELKINILKSLDFLKQSAFGREIHKNLTYAVYGTYLPLYYTNGNKYIKTEELDKNQLLVLETGLNIYERIIKIIGFIDKVSNEDFMRITKDYVNYGGVLRTDLKCLEEIIDNYNTVNEVNNTDTDNIKQL